MNECNSIGISKTKLSEKTKCRLSEISGIENHFHQEISQKKSCIKKLSKNITAFDYIGKTLIALSATSGGVSIISFTSVVGAPDGIASTSFTLIYRNNKKVTKQNKKQKEKSW